MTVKSSLPPYLKGNFTLHMPSEARKTYAGAKFSNALPEHCKALELMNLKKELKSWLSHRPFYIISEFLSWQEDEQID